jgi:hypothetical protein
MVIAWGGREVGVGLSSSVIAWGDCEADVEIEHSVITWGGREMGVRIEQFGVRVVVLLYCEWEG